MRRAYLQQNGRVTLPLQWRQKHGLKKGDKVSYVETENGLIVVPVMGQGKAERKNSTE